jgi:hypothetical protein
LVPATPRPYDCAAGLAFFERVRSGGCEKFEALLAYLSHEEDALPKRALGIAPRSGNFPTE